jgi:hypothetical protein
MKRIFGNGSYANVTATLALVIALGGTSYAAIKLPKNSVSTLQVKDRSLLKKDFRPGQLPAGKKGATGAQGPEGPAGPGGGGGSSALVNRAEAVDALVPGNGDQVIQSINLPAGAWAVTAKFVAENGTAVEGVGKLSCSLTIGGGAVDSLGPGGIDFDPGAASVTLTGGGTLGAAGTAAVICNTANTVAAGSYRARSITAVSAASVAGG